MQHIREIGQDFFFNQLDDCYQNYLNAGLDERFSKKYWYNKCYVFVYHIFNDEYADKQRLKKYCLDRSPIDKIYLGLDHQFNTCISAGAVNIDKNALLISKLEEVLNILKGV